MAELFDIERQTHEIAGPIRIACGNVEIVSPDGQILGTTIKIDGHEIRNVESIHFHVSTNTLPRVTLKVLAIK